MLLQDSGVGVACGAYASMAVAVAKPGGAAACVERSDHREDSSDGLASLEGDMLLGPSAIDLPAEDEASPSPMLDASSELTSSSLKDESAAGPSVVGLNFSSVVEKRGLCGRRASALKSASVVRVMPPFGPKVVRRSLTSPGLTHMRTEERAYRSLTIFQIMLPIIARFAAAPR